ncbi:MAG: ATP-binding protein [Crenarchaeota archaeon]|nr:ATP-binding protein [Thermoproteota archaeon]
MLKKTMYDIVRNLIKINIDVRINDSMMITKHGNKVIVQKFLIADKVEYGINDLDNSDILKIMDNYASLIERLPPGIEILIMKREKDLVKLSRKISNEMMNIRAKLDVVEEPHIRTRLLSRLKVLEELYKMIITSNNVTKLQIVFKIRSESKDVSSAIMKVKQYEELVLSIFNNYFRIKLRPLSSSEIKELLAYNLGLVSEFNKSSIILEHSRLKTLAPIRLHSPAQPATDNLVLIGYDIDTELPFGLNVYGLFKHVIILGPTGKGKTTLLATIIESMLSMLNLRIFAFDFKGDLARYVDNDIIDVVNPSIYPINILVRPPWLKLIDWGIIVKDVLENIVGLSTKNIADILKIISRERVVRRPEDILTDPNLSRLSPVIDLLINDPDYDKLDKLLNKGNVLFNISTHGTMYQNAYAGLILGICSNLLLQYIGENEPLEKRDDKNSHMGNVIIIDEAWRVSNLYSIKRLVKEGRSRKVSVIMATQNPTDVPRELYENIQTIVVFGSPNKDYQEQVHEILGVPRKILRRLSYLSVGEALVVDAETRRPIIVKIKPPRGIRSKMI